MNTLSNVVETGTEIEYLEMFTKYNDLQLGSKQRPRVMPLLKENSTALCSFWPASRPTDKYCCGWSLGIKTTEDTVITQGNSQGYCSWVKGLGDPQTGPRETELHNFSYSRECCLLFYLDSISTMFKHKLKQRGKSHRRIRKSVSPPI